MAKLLETDAERAISYGELLMKVAHYFQSNRKRFKSAISRVSDMLDVREIEELRAMARDDHMDSPGMFEDRFEEILWAKDQDTKREIVRLMLRHL